MKNKTVKKSTNPRGRPVGSTRPPVLPEIDFGKLVAAFEKWLTTTQKADAQLRATLTEYTSKFGQATIARYFGISRQAVLFAIEAKSRIGTTLPRYLEHAKSVLQERRK